MRYLGFISAGLLLCATVVSAGPPPDLAKIERRIKRQPVYTAKEPLYGLYVFGPEVKTRVWAVLDKSAADSGQYDILYFDRDGDGDLTDENDRITGDLDERDGGVKFIIGDLSDSSSGDKHTSLTLSRREPKDGSVMLKLDWRGRETMRGGYAEVVGPYTQFASAIAEAPILWFDASGHFAFQPWIMEKELRIGNSADIRVFLGHQGIGKNTFCAVSQEFLPEKAPVLATLIYTDKEGREQRQLNHFLERC